jgi:predicted acetyltransferase
VPEPAGRLVLRSLRSDDEADAMAAHRELLADDFSFLNTDVRTPFGEVVAQLERERAGTALPAGRVPSSFLVAELGGTLVGRACVRHELNDWLLRWGGHIGYAVRPAWRRRGIATEVLRRSLTHLREVSGAERALLTCDDHNLASAATIERCGGVLEDVVPGHADGPPKRRYWVPTSA